MKKIIKLLFLIFLIVASILILRKANTPIPYQTNSGKIFGTTYNITYSSRNNLEKEILAVLNEVDGTFSTFNPNSIISRINKNEEVETDTMFRHIYYLARRVSETTDGAFDITIAPLVNAWGFGFKNKENISEKHIDSICSFIGYQKIWIDKNKIIQKADKRIMLDCSAVAKGFGSDAVAKCLDKKNVDNYMIEIGGEIVSKGVNKEGKIWSIGIVKPQEENTEHNNEIKSILRLSNIALATSGNYRNFYYKDGKKYAHTIDPNTGHPVQHSILSSTVIAPTCAEADAFATAFMVTGLEKAKKILQDQPQLKAFFIYSDKDGNDQIWYSNDLGNSIVR